MTKVVVLFYTFIVYFITKTINKRKDKIHKLKIISVTSMIHYEFKNGKRGT